MSTEFLILLSLIIIANGAPVIIRWLLNDRLSLAIDFNLKLSDDNHVLGASKTWRGVAAAILATTIAAQLFSYPPEIGFQVAIYAILGDLFSSFIKRRLSMPASSMAPLLDQVPESLLPAFMLMTTFRLDAYSLLLLSLIFVILELLLSHILFRWGLRKRDY